MTVSTRFLKSLEDEKVKTIAIEIFSHFVEAASTIVREYILNEPDAKLTTRQASNNTNNENEEIYENSLLNLVIKYMINDPDQGNIGL